MAEAPLCAPQPDPRVSRRAGAAPQSYPRHLPPSAARYARRQARWPGHLRRRSCGHCQRSLRAPSPSPKAWVARPPRIRPSQPISLPGTDRGHRRSPPLRRRSGKCFAHRSRALKPARSCGKLARSRNSPVASSITATAKDALWGSTPMSTFMRMHAPPFRSDLLGPSPPSARAKDIPTSCRAHTSFESLRAVLYGGTQA